MKSKVILSLFETVRLSVSISLRDLYNSLKSIKERGVYLSLSIHDESDVLVSACMCFSVGMELRACPLRNSYRLFM